MQQDCILHFAYYYILLNASVGLYSEYSGLFSLHCLVI